MSPGNPSRAGICFAISAIALSFFCLSPGPALGDQAPADYTANLGGKVEYWHPNKMPLRVFLDANPNVPNFKPKFKDYFLGACQSWSEASQGKITFKFVDKDQADIHVNWTNDISQLLQKGELGEAQWESDPRGMYHASIKLLTVSEDGKRPIGDQEAKLMCLHELGHALGLVKHSPYLGDIMNACIDFNYSTPIDALTLSQRDKNTILKLYTEGDALVEKLSAESDDPRVKLMRLCYRATNLLQEEKYDAAYILLDRALNIDANCVQALSAMSNCCFEQGMDYYVNGDFARAIQRLERFISVANTLKMDNPQINQAKETISRCKSKLSTQPAK